MTYLFMAMLILWIIVLLYVVFLVNKQKQLEELVRELQHEQQARISDET